MTVNTNNARVLPAHWNTEDVLDGLAIVPKAELEGVPFRITAVQFKTNPQSEISYVYVDAEYVSGETFTFNDSSSGVRAQIIEWLKARGRDAVVDTGEIESVSIVIPHGLRVSEFEVKVADDRGRFVDKTARTYYLTTSGKRATADKAPDAPKTLRGAAAKAAKAVTR